MTSCCPAHYLHARCGIWQHQHKPESPQQNGSIVPLDTRTICRSSYVFLNVLKFSLLIVDVEDCLEP